MTKRRSTATKRQRPNQQTLTMSLPSIPSSFSSSSHHPHIPPGGDSLHAPLPSLPFELIVEILVRLPVKFLLQLKCVCKSWNSLISDPQFSKKHLRASSMDPTRNHLILRFMNPSREFLLRVYSLPSMFNTLSVTTTEFIHPLSNRKRYDLMVGSVHGILCFVIDDSFVLLWNPSIRKSKKLPPLQNEPLVDVVDSYTAYGFGYDHMGHSYKVVSVFSYDDDGNKEYKTEVRVHTLGANSWRRIQEFPYGAPLDTYGSFVNGMLHWLAGTYCSSSCVIVCLDLGKESNQEILQPNYGKDFVVTLTLGVLRDSLCILCLDETLSWDVWHMTEYGNVESWTKLCTVPHVGDARVPLLMTDAGPLLHAMALCVSEDDEILLQFLSKLVVYNCRNGTFKTLEFPIVYGSAASIMESLISPCS